jgi:hypothetical protein
VARPRIDQDHTRFRQIVGQDQTEPEASTCQQGELIGKQGQASSPSRAADRRCRASASARTGRAASARARASPGTAGAGAAGEATAAGRPARAKASTRSRSTSRSTSWRRSWARSSSCRASSPRAASSSSPPGSLHRHHAPSGRVAAALQAHVPEALKRQIAMGTYDPDRPVVMPIKRGHRYRTLQAGEPAAGQRGHHLHDGRVGLDG